MPTKTTKTTKANKTPDNKMQLFEKIQELEARNKKLTMAVGRIRTGVLSVKFPHAHRDTMDKVLEQVDRVLSNI
tara:strand:- start:221 stop:442 length:222 start_codon:yes stop_codon:yes gene_type:complete